MSSKQKSFFDQTPKNSYQRFCGLRRPLFTHQRESHPRTISAPPIAASARSKSKLSRYRYSPFDAPKASADLHRAMALEDKENETQDAIYGPTRHGPIEVPQTPVSRVPFADLISNKEELFDCPMQSTPADSVTWKHSPRSSTSKSTSTPRGKKRSRSSSPPLSLQREPFQFELHNCPPGLSSQTARNSLVTNLDNPSLDFESRYFREFRTPNKPPATVAIELIHSSSPQTPDVCPTTAKLRRTVSCGIAYPSSRKRRRKLSNEYVASTSKSTIDKSLIPCKNKKSSKLSVLLDQIEQAGQILHEPKEVVRISSSSPLPDRFNRLHTQVSKNQIHHGKDNTKAKISTIPHNRVVLDDNTLLSKDNGYGEISSLNALSTNGSGLQRNGICYDLESYQQRVIKYREPEESKKGEFDDGDGGDGGGGDGDDDEIDDTLAADLEILASKYDSQSIQEAFLPQKQAQYDPLTRSNDGNLEEIEADCTLSRQKINGWVELSSDEEFGGDDFDDIVEEIGNLTQSVENQDTCMTNESILPRFLIKGVINSQYEISSGRKAPEKLLRLQEHRTEMIKIAALRQSWLDSDTPIDAWVHVFGNFDKNGFCVIDNAQGLLIVHPDNLLSATVVADAYKCLRRAVLQDRVKATNEANEAQVYGHVLHEMFQEALTANRWDDSWFDLTIRTITSRHLEGFFELNVTVERAVQHLQSKVPELQSWAKLFLNAKHNPRAFVKGPGEKLVPTIVTKLLDTEEHVWSPKYGLKGNVDATVQVSIVDDGNARNLTVPLEMKTGKKREKEENMSHNSQTALYTLLLSDRYDVQIAFGILYYLETSEMSRIVCQRREIAGMIQRRNELASYVRHRLTLPPMLKNQHTCSRCYAQNSCFVYHKLVENGDGQSSGLEQTFTEATKHLNPLHAEFFRNWDSLLTKEESDTLKFRKELWTMISSERENVGRCFGNVVVKPGSVIETKVTSKINRFEYAFVKAESGPNFSFTESQISPGEPIVVSDESGHYALANGYVTKIRKSEISVAVDRRLHNARMKSVDFDEQNNQSFAGIMEIDGLGGRSIKGQRQTSVPPKYRLDKDEFSNGMATVRNNLIRIMEKDLFGARFLQRMVIENASPKFIAAPSSLKAKIEHINNDLNIDQRNAVLKVMEAQEYALVLGMPGTGKTTTIAHIIRALTSIGKSVLLTSYTHTAVDNTLLKIRNDKLSILRIGAEAKIHPDIKEFADLASIPKATFGEVEKSYKSQVVATTCLGINHPIFNQRTFDYCIVDEASQITLPVCLGPIRMAYRFVLVGDHFQLPPLVQNKEARDGGLDVSLFKLLSERHPCSVIGLEHQYRMCKDIMSLSNTLIYNGKLKCGTAAVANRSIRISNFQGLNQHHYSFATLGPFQTNVCTGPNSSDCWLSHAINPSRHVIFINTDQLGNSAREIANGSRITNPLEVNLATQIVRAFISVGVDPGEVGVITLYRSQLSILQHSLRMHIGPTTDSASSVEMHTADRFQGRDKEAVVLSLVRSNENGNVGELLQDWRRVNVALTRARTKLIVLGSFGTISKGNNLLSKFCGLVEQQGWRFDLQPKAVDGHFFEEMSSQLSGIGPTKMDMKDLKSISPRTRLSSTGKLPCKTHRLDPATLLKARPILRDVVNDLLA